MKFLALTLIKVSILTFFLVTSAGFIVGRIIPPISSAKPQQSPTLPNIIIKEVTVTAYSPSKSQTSGDNPFEMASTLIATPNDLWQLAET